MPVAYLDCFAGISGDMFLGALLGAGVPLSVLEDAVKALGLDASLRVETVNRSGISSTKVYVLEGGELAEGAIHAHPHTYAHEHPHLHQHTHEHTHNDGVADSHPHVHEHADQAVHAEESGHAHKHEYAHGLEKSHNHDHKPEMHAHEHAHEAGHRHQHDHGPEPVHGQEHDPEHGHKQGHDQEHDHDHPHVHGRTLTVIRKLIEASSLSQVVKEFAVCAFEALGHSEAKIHNVPVDQIHFHEVGAVDAIVDIVASAAGVAYLEREGRLQWFSSPVNVGGGMVECAHGLFPVPAPATADLLRGMPTYSAHMEKELVTPTGAALLRALAPSFGRQPAMRVEAIGYGAGTRNPKGFPNLLRLSLGEATEFSGRLSMTLGVGPANAAEEAVPGGKAVMVLEAALDDASPQVLAHVAERALAQGALDVMLAPVLMKKGRPGTLMTVLCELDESALFEELLLRETTTLGVRMHREQRSCLERRHVRVLTPYGEVRVKIGLLRGEEVNAAPEFEDCRAAAERHGVPVKQVIQAAAATYSTSGAGVA
jgi:uncharacterized protein (TIGR00299 family) protein